MAETDVRMLHSDAFAWYMEKDPVLRSTVVGIVRLDRSPDRSALRARIDRLTRLVPQLRERVDAPPMRLGPPRWSIDDAFDLDFHLRHARVAAPGDWAQVLAYARNAAMDDFDRTRPLWEFTLLDGMADGGAAFITKLHHSLTDGIGGMQLAALVFDPAKNGPPPKDFPEPPDGHHLSSGDLIRHTVRDDAGEAATATQRAIRSVPASVLSSMRHPMAGVANSASAARSIARIVAPVNRQISTVLGDRATRRSLATLDVPVEALHDAAAAAGGHLNDAFLAALVGGLQRYHERRGAPLDTIRVTVPVSVRTAKDSIGGNRITLVRVKLPAAIKDPAERIRGIAEVTRQWRREPALRYTQPIAYALNLMPRSYIGGMLKRVELLASDVPGISTPVWLAGAKVTGYYPFGPTIGAAANATLLSYAGTCNVGINIDLDAVDEPDDLVRCIEEGFAEVLAVRGASPRRPARPRR